jgi:hypothetical protein
MASARRNVAAPLVNHLGALLIPSLVDGWQDFGAENAEKFNWCLVTPIPSQHVGKFHLCCNNIPIFSLRLRGSA